MISFSKLLLEQKHFGDSLRYHSSSEGQSYGTNRGKGPIVVWNCTRTCNLKCRHCYAEAIQGETPSELTTVEGKAFMDSLVAYHVPVLLFSGGEPLMRKDGFELMEYGKKIGLRMVISTNGTLIDREKADRIKQLGVSYVGISLDGIGAVNDNFRGIEGAYEEALSGFRYCKEANQKTGLRLTLSKSTYKELNSIFDLIEAERIPRVCFYHLAYSGRGSRIKEEDLSQKEKRDTLDFIIEKTLDYGKRNIRTEILTVDNHCDGIYVYNFMKKINEKKSQEILRLLTINGGNRSGTAISSVDWEGNVYIDQFTRDIPIGNIKEKDFRDIWNGEDNLFLQKLRSRKNYLQGRCRVCKWIQQCGGNLRARALSTGDFWASDPGCYFTDEEIGYQEGVLC